MMRRGLSGMALPGVERLKERMQGEACPGNAFPEGKGIGKGGADGGHEGRFARVQNRGARAKQGTGYRLFEYRNPLNVNDESGIVAVFAPVFGVETGDFDREGGRGSSRGAGASGRTIHPRRQNFDQWES